MATWRVLFDDTKQGQGGVWYPRDADGESVILDEYHDLSASNRLESVVIYTTPNDATTRAIMARALDNNPEVREWDVSLDAALREAITADAYAYASAVAPKFDSTDQVGWIINEEDLRARVLAYIRQHGYDPRDILDNPEWLCERCGTAIAYNEQCLGFRYICQSCARDA